VFYGRWGSTDVALKRLKNKDEEKSFLRELKVLSTLRHPSKLHILAAC
jgi:serine/threonine protein kinase